MSGATVLPERGVPIVAGLFDMACGEPALLGARCRGCGALYFPPTDYCRNPDCHTKQVERCVLPTRGTLYSFTVQRYQPPPLFRIDDWSPYAIGLVDLGDGLQVMGMLAGIALDEIRIGMPLRLIIAPLFADTEHGSVLTYKFAPDELSGGEL